MYCSPNKIRVIKSRRIRWAGHLARMGEGRCECWILMGKPEEKMSFGTPKRSWYDIKMELKEAG